MSDDKGAKPAGIDYAITRDSLYGIKAENTHSGVLSYLRLRYTKDLDGVDVAVTGIPYDLAVTNRPGTRFGPRAIRAASTNLAWQPSWPWDFDPLDRLACIDYGDCDIDHGHPDKVPAQIQDHIAGIISAGASTLGFGGDHFITGPILRAYAEKLGRPVAIVHFDAHSDTWSEEESRIDHGTMFYHAVKDGIIDVEHSVQIGIRTYNEDPLGLTWLDANQVHEKGPARIAEEAKRIVGDAPAYLTFDIDCLDPAYAPGTGTPVVGGLSTWQARRIVCALDGIDFVGMDLVEVAPQYDVGEVTSLAGATLAFDYLHLRARDLPVKAG